MLWQDWQATSLRACALWSQCTCSPFMWQARQTSACADGFMYLKFRIA
jgi:hypothetical protein